MKETKYVPYDERVGNESIVYFTRDLSEKGLEKAYRKICGNLKGKVAVKLHTGEAHGPNILPREWVKKLMNEELKDASIVETNTYYEGDRYTTEAHRKTLAINGWNFAPVDIMDEEGTVLLPVKGGKYFTNMSVGSHETNYDSMLVLTHFKGMSWAVLADLIRILVLAVLMEELARRLFTQRKIVQTCGQLAKKSSWKELRNQVKRLWISLGKTLPISMS